MIVSVDDELEDSVTVDKPPIKRIDRSDFHLKKSSLPIEQKVPVLPVNSGVKPEITGKSGEILK
jgi:hypothetical protein